VGIKGWKGLRSKTPTVPDVQLSRFRFFMEELRSRRVYCQAVLSHDQRIALDGTPAETVDADAKDLAAKRLATLAARKAAKKVGKPAAPAAVKPKPAPAAPTETPEQLRDRVRAALLRRSA
jgi:sRNA-binding protein